VAAIANGILFSEAFAAEGAVVFTKACELGLEGIVSKRAGSWPLSLLTGVRYALSLSEGSDRRPAGARSSIARDHPAAKPCIP
jgi:hypothetical protein